MFTRYNLYWVDMCVRQLHSSHCKCPLHRSAYSSFRYRALIDHLGLLGGYKKRTALYGEGTYGLWIWFQKGPEADGRPQILPDLVGRRRTKSLYKELAHAVSYIEEKQSLEWHGGKPDLYLVPSTF